jgi:glycosyltransferase involved in cell wall biosynthesis
MSVALKVAIDCRVVPGASGGVPVAVKSLVTGLGQLTDGPEEYTLIVESAAQREWLIPRPAPNLRLVVRSRGAAPARRPLSRLLRPIVDYLQHALDRRAWPEVPISDGFYEGLGCSVLHLPAQRFTVCAMPTIYNPHDLQHLHYPQFFTPWTLAWRETVYPAGCHFAHTVVVGSQWVKQDVVRRYRVDPEKIQVIPEAAPTQAASEPTALPVERVRRQYQLERPFVVFPGVAWPHKNHLRLFEALARLREDRALIVDLVCTGGRYDEFWSQIEAGIQTFGLAGQVRFLGYLPEDDLRAIYRLATCLVLPSLYEASSLPVFEAWLDGLPVACSHATALPEQVDDAALLFDPTDVGAIADAIARLMTNDGQRLELRARGYERLKDFDLLRTAKAYRATYRRAAGVHLTDEDLWLLQVESMRRTHGGPLS